MPGKYPGHNKDSKTVGSAVLELNVSKAPFDIYVVSKTSGKLCKLC